MSIVLSATPQSGQHAGLPVLTCDDSGNLAVVGALVLSEQAAAPVTQAGATAIYIDASGNLAVIGPNSASAALNLSGTLVYSSGGGVFTRDPNGTVSSLVAGGQAGGEPTGVVASTCHAFTASASASPTSGTLYLQRVWLAAGQTISKVGFVTGLTAATGPTHWWTAILDNTYKQVAHSADQLATAIPASTWQNLPLTGTFTASYSGAYFLAVMIATSTTQPTLVSTTTVPNAALISGTGALGPVPGGTSTTGLTAPGTDGTTTYATPTAAANFYYMFAS